MNYYNILQVDENATQEKIKQAYYKIACIVGYDMDIYAKTYLKAYDYSFSSWKTSYEETD